MRWLRQQLRRLAGQGELPDDFPGTLEGTERVLAVTTLTTGEYLVLTQLGLWVPEGDSARRIGWQWISKAVWDEQALIITEALQEADAGEAVVLRDLPARRFTLRDPGQVPELVRARVTNSIRSSQHRDLPGGGAWFVQRKIPGRDGVVLQVRPDPGTDTDAVEAVARKLAERIRAARERQY